MKAPVFLFLLLAFFPGSRLRSQSGKILNGQLLNLNDSSILSSAALKLMETGDYASTDQNGKFSFSIPSKLKTVHLDVSYISCHHTTAIELQDQRTLRIFIDCPPLTLGEVLISGMEPRGIVKKAVAAIPFNYATSSHFAYGFFRQYEKVNGEYRNLVEDQGVMMLKLNIEKSGIMAQEALSTFELRRSNYYKTELPQQDDFLDFMSQNAVYHLAQSSLNPRSFDYYTFSFDTLADRDHYVIDYLCKDFSSDAHGVGNVSDVTGESWETGRLVIDKSSYTIVKLERNAYRNKNYNYPKNNNFVLPDRKFTEEFCDGHLIIEYTEMYNKHYLKKMVYSYTNNFFRTGTYAKAYTITDNLEWYCDSISASVSGEALNRFYQQPSLNKVDYKYHPNAWQKKIPDFYFSETSRVIADLQKPISLEEQFKKNGR